MNYSRKILNYWMQSVSDGDRLNFNEKEIVNFVELPKEEIEAGQIAVSSLEIIEKKVGGGWSSESLNVLICPNPQCKPGRNQSEKNRLFPLVIPGRLEVDGSLHPQKNEPPFIPRKYLEPTHAKSPIVGQLNTAEKYRERKPHSDEGTWEMVWQDAQELMKKVTGKNGAQYQLQGFQPLSHAVVWFGEVSSIPYQEIAKCYEDLTKQNPIPELLKNYTEGAWVGKASHYLEEHGNYSTHHLGQMTDRYPLTISQREALHHFFALENGQLLGINGPPGTGKTTLIQSVVSSLWIQKALAQSEPPIILASSSNNTAIWNILDSFAEAVKGISEDDGESMLFSRWIDGVESFGMTCVAKNKLKNILSSEKRYAWAIRQRAKSRRGDELDGFHSELEKRSIEEQIETFLTHCCTYFGESRLTLDQAKKRLHIKLQQIGNQIEDQSAFFHSRKRFHSQLKKDYNSTQGLEIKIEEITKKKNESRDAFESIDALFKEWLRERGRFFLIRWFTPVQKWANELFFQKQESDLVLNTFKDRDIRKQLLALKNTSEQEYTKNKDQYNKMIKFKNQLELSDKRWEEWKEQEVEQEKDNHTKLYTEMDFEIRLLSKLDTHLRYHAFWLASHYWEARWLEERHDQQTNAFESEEKTWYRYAKLTPCMVSTVLSAPKFFKRLRKPNDYLYNFIDLLIFDESGQVLPEQTAPVFSLAKKALIVGDTEQLQPIPRVSLEVDEANMQRMGLISSQDELNSFVLTGLASSSGSAMKIAQQASPFSKHKDLGGMLLTEHYRCSEDIIQYCNDLCYHGRLIPMKNNPIQGEEVYPGFPTMGYVDIEGTAEKVGGSWENHREAAYVATWIANRSEELTQERQLKDVLAVVTPFRRQADLIDSYLKREFQIEGLTVDTVHSLQGAEKDIILFSATYAGPEVKKQQLFYDDTRYLLNVAVSRAKESFLVLVAWMCLVGKTRRIPPVCCEIACIHFRCLRRISCWN
ncbi:DEAD/DEAH box helicase [Marininema halotolerans]|uniref:Superfamily I DNA and/or RNA helicase n=1 Tax=Marininema halotolerans TaxID=1155944 RepID=A0A1I6R3X8_9BACL|nr:DEAD/DEAH box helicase [Marininema halotolerans]SFS59386.1 Superfamily I DNA and/or RNA helicase [Marininema halotolerans]